MRFLFRWQHVEPASRLTGLDGLREVVAMLDGFELAAGAWERHVLAGAARSLRAVDARHAVPRRRSGWARLSPVARRKRRAASARARDADRAVPARARTPRGGRCGRTATTRRSSEAARASSRVLRSRGASFFADLASACGLDADQLRAGARRTGRVRARDVRRILRPARARVGGARPSGASRRRSNFAGRWTAIARQRRTA